MACRNHRYLKRLYHLFNGACHWCGVQTYLKPPSVKTKGFNPNMATRDHLDDRFSPERGKHPGKRRVVLACHACNNRRGAESQRAQPIAELWRRSRRVPSTGRGEATSTPES